MTEHDRESIMDIFNFYVENSYAAYPEQRLPYDFYDVFLSMCKGYPAVTVRNGAGDVVGFGMLRPYHAMPAFSKTAEITYFIKPDCTGQRIGKRLLDHLEDEGRKKGLTSILASISSLNAGSLRFHVSNGFVECGRFKSIGQKRGEVFDVVYCQKML